MTKNVDAKVGSPVRCMQEAGPRSMARFWAVRALFSQLYTPVAVDDLLGMVRTLQVLDELADSGSMAWRPSDHELLDAVVRSAVEHTKPLHEQIASCLPSGWAWERVDPVMRAVLWAAGGEMRTEAAAPSGVVTNEYVTLAAAFGGDTAAGFVNRILGAMLPGTAGRK